MITEDAIINAISNGKKDPRKSKIAEHNDSAVDLNLFRKMRMGIDVWHKIDLIGEGRPEDMIHMRILSIAEIMDVEREALDWFAKLPPMQQVISLLDKQKAILTIKKALSSGRDSPDDYKCLMNQETIERMSYDGIKLLLNKYEEINLKYNPNLDTLSDEEYLQYMEELKKKPHLVKDLSRARSDQIFIRFLQDANSLMDSARTLFSQVNT